MVGRRSSDTAPPARDGLVHLAIEVDPLAQQAVPPIFVDEDLSTAHDPEVALNGHGLLPGCSAAKER